MKVSFLQYAYLPAHNRKVETPTSFGAKTDWAEKYILKRQENKLARANGVFAANFNYADFFTPLETIRTQMIKLLREVNRSSAELPDVITKRIVNSISNNDFDIGKIYLEFMNNMKSMGYKIGKPSKKLASLIERGDEVNNKYYKLPDPDARKLEEEVFKYAKRASNYWGDYRSLTDDNWLVVRFIRNKTSFPQKTKYNQERLTDMYLYRLYRNYAGQRYTNNPLYIYDSTDVLNNDMIKIINGIYMPLYNNPNMNFNEAGFQHFAACFDKRAIGKSIQHMEDLYRSHFMNIYRTPERVAALEKQKENARKLIKEKIDFSKLLQERENPKPKKRVQAELFSD